MHNNHENHARMVSDPGLRTYDPLFMNYRKLNAAIVLRAIRDYVQYRKGTHIHDQAAGYLRTVGWLDDAGIHMTGKDVMTYLDRHPKALDDVKLLIQSIDLKDRVEKYA